MLAFRKKFDCPALPPGWIREEVTRVKGLSSGKVDVYYYSPTGKKLRTRGEVLHEMQGTIPVGSFDFKTGNIILKQMKQKPLPVEYCRSSRNDASLIPPIRQTASIFKQPVTLIKSDSKTKHDVIKSGPQEKPKQLFWEKQLEGLRACNQSGIEICPMELPKILKPIGSYLNSETILQSITTSLHVYNHPITGQTSNPMNLDKYPCSYINPEQPLVMEVNIKQEDINKQQETILNIRNKLKYILNTNRYNK